MEKTSVIEFAKKHGYETADYICEWNGYSCYEPILANGEVTFVGLPLIILEDKKGNIRMSTSEEAMKQIDECG